MTKFTKGPWGISSRFANVRIVPESDGMGTTIATMGNWNGEFADEQRANANLIAAAPEMYEALKAAEKCEAALILEWADFWDVAPQALIDALLEAQRLRYAALAKAVPNA